MLYTPAIHTKDGCLTKYSGLVTMVRSPAGR